MKQVIDEKVAYANSLASYCIKCGFCEPVCPTISAFGNSPVHGSRGRVLLFREIRSGSIKPDKKSVEPFFSCLLCGACKDACPVEIDVGEVSRFMRREAFSSGKAPSLVYIMREAFIAKGDPLAMGKLEWVLNLPAKGRYLLFTGGLYQLMAYTEPAVSILRRLKSMPSLIELGIKTGLSSLLLKFRAEKLYTRALSDVVNLLSGLGVYYRPELDAYSGILTYEMGMEDEFAEHAKRVAKGLSGKKVVVIDPHTAYVLTELYPKYVEGFDVEVSHYVELLPYRFRLKGRVTFQEPCYLLRHFRREGVRPVLERIEGVELEKAKASCCGGPIEFLFGERSERIARRRGKELNVRKADMFVTACPVCMASFRRAGYNPIDLSAFLISAIKSLY